MLCIDLSDTDIVILSFSFRLEYSSEMEVLKIGFIFARKT